MSKRWIKATVFPIHEKEAIKKDPKHAEWLRNHVIRVRVAHNFYIKARRCDAQTFYEVHPKDAQEIFPNWQPGILSALCEHEIRLIASKRLDAGADGSKKAARRSRRKVSHVHR